MWIFLSVVAILATIIAFILMLPVDIIIKSGDEGELQLRYKFLFKTYGDKAPSSTNNPILKAVKKTTGIEKLEIKTIKKSLKDKSYVPTVVETVSILKGLLKEVGRLLKHFRARLFKIDITCAADDAADAAINYGQYSALVYPLLGAASAFMKIPKRARQIKLGFDASLKQDSIRYNIVITIRVFRILSAFFKIIYAEAKRSLENDAPKDKSAKERKGSQG